LAYFKKYRLEPDTLSIIGSNQMKTPISLPPISLPLNKPNQMSLPLNKPDGFKGLFYTKGHTYKPTTK